MSLILNIETSTTNCSVSLSHDAETVVLMEDNSLGYSHAELLHVFIKKLFEKADYKLNDIDAVAVSNGPGSYTGLRIGVSTAKGLCFALDRPLLAIDTLEILAHQIEAERGYVVPMLDARRMEVYSAIFNSNFEWVRGVASEILHTDSFIEQLQVDTVHFIGNGVEKTKSLIKHKNAVFIEDKLPSAKEMGHLAETKYKISDTEDVAYFEPYYLKDFIALKKKS